MTPGAGRLRNCLARLLLAATASGVTDSGAAALTLNP
jgi:hypothetical protein